MLMDLLANVPHNIPSELYLTSRVKGSAGLCTSLCLLVRGALANALPCLDDRLC